VVHLSQSTAPESDGMNEWDQRIREHQVWIEMRNLGPVIDGAAAVPDPTGQAVLGLERLRAILAYIGKRIAAADPLVTAPGPLDAIGPVLAAVQNELTAFISDKNPAHIVTANVTADGALIAVGQVPGAYSPEELGVLVSSTTGYRSVVSEALTEAQQRLRGFKDESDKMLTVLGAKSEENLNLLSARAEALQGSLNAISSSVDAERQRLANIASEQQGQFSASQEARSTQFNENFRASTERFTQLVTDYQKQFSDAQDTRGKENTAAELARQTKYNETLAEYVKKLTEQDAEFTKQRAAFVAESTKRLETLATEYDEKAAKLLAEVDEKRKHVEKLVGVIGNLGVTSGYQQAANAARGGMWGWQGTTLAAMITLSVLAYKTLGALELPGGRFNWGGFAARALLLLSLGAIAAYSGVQADKLFTSERRNRKLALELEAIGPYLAPLPEEERNKFIVLIGERSFGHETDLHDHRKSPTSVLDFLKSDKSKDFVNFIIETAEKAKKLKD
jgi:hypothetical protein